MAAPPKANRLGGGNGFFHSTVPRSPIRQNSRGHLRRFRLLAGSATAEIVFPLRSPIRQNSRGRIGRSRLLASAATAETPGFPAGPSNVDTVPVSLWVQRPNALIAIDTICAYPYTSLPFLQRSCVVILHSTERTESRLVVTMLFGSPTEGMAIRQALGVALCVLVSLTGGGCANSPTVARNNPLLERLRPKPITPGPNDVVIEVVYLERPFADQLMNHEAWASADDQHLPLAVLRDLEERGFRVGLLGGQLPDVLGKLLEEQDLEPFNGQRMQLPQGTPTQIFTSGRYNLWPGRISHELGEGAQPYRNAVGSLRVLPKIQRDGSVELSLRPEIQYGQARRQYVPDHMLTGPLNWTIRIARPAHSFETMRFSLALRPDQTALIGCVPDQPESLGARFFSRWQDGRRIQRLLLIRAEAPGYKAETDQ